MIDRRMAAFSASELLASLAVVAILSAVHLVHRFDSKRRASVIVCVRNLRLLAQATSISTADSGKTVHYEEWPHLWMRGLAAYGIAEADRLCPTTPKRTPSQIRHDASPSGSITRPWLVSGTPDTYQGAYCLNGYFYSDAPYTDSTLSFRTESDLRAPARVPIYADSIWVDAWPRETDLPARNLANGDNFIAGGLSRIAIPRHIAPALPNLTNFDPQRPLPGAVNAAFADGHVELIRLEKLWTLDWHRTWQSPQRRPGS